MTDEEVLAKLRLVFAHQEKMEGVLGAMVVGLRVLARDVLAVANVAPGDPLRPMIVGGARDRALMVLASLGDDARAH